jgi:hypothetical protein
LNWLKTTISQAYGFLPSITILESERYAFVGLAWNMLFTKATVEVVAFTWGRLGSGAGDAPDLWILDLESFTHGVKALVQDDG